MYSRDNIRNFSIIAHVDPWQKHSGRPPFGADRSADAEGDAGADPRQHGA